MEDTHTPNDPSLSKTEKLFVNPDDASGTQPPMGDGIIKTESSIKQSGSHLTAAWTGPENVGSQTAAPALDSPPPSDATVIRSSENSVPIAPPVVQAKNNIPDVKIISDNVVSGNLPSSVQLGNFTLVECIGGGGMGRVYRALDSKLDRYVALKVLAPNQNSEDFRERFTIEAKAAAKLHHENIVTVYSYGDFNGLTYLAMEYIPGVNIRDLVNKNGPLSIEDTLSYAIQLASALEHINQMGIVHRDIKPSNVLITEDGIAKVIDLGLAKNSMSPADELTATGVTLGTFDYISPEQARDPRLVDIRSDIYSLGCSLFFMLSGQPPYPKGTALQKLLRHQGEAPPNVQDFRSDVPDRLATIITRCMAKNADMRYQTPQQLSKALYIAAEELGMRPLGISLAKWYLPSISRIKIWKDRLWWILPVVFLVLIVLILDGIWKLPDRDMEFLPDAPGLHGEIDSFDIPKNQPTLDTPMSVE